jgi:glutamine synthetase
MFRKIDSLNDALLEAKNYTDLLKVARFYKDTVLTAMQEVRVVADEMEMLTDSSCWPFPPYGELLFKT